MQTDEIGFEELYITGPDGLRLYLRDYGRDAAGGGERLPVICLPGLSRNSRDFHALALHLSLPGMPHTRRVICMDYRGRGRSDRDPDKSRYQLPVEAGDVISICKALGIERGIFIGTSRGGLILHLLAAMRPDLLAGILLNDIGPVIEIEGLLHIRDYLAPAAPPESWLAAAERMKSLHGAVFPRLEDNDWIDMARAIYWETDGVITADFDPALTEPLAALDKTTPLPDLWDLYAHLACVPTMIIRGEHSTILSEHTFAEMQLRHPKAIGITAEGQGHAPILHLEPLRTRIADFISRI